MKALIDLVGGLDECIPIDGLYNHYQLYRRRNWIERKVCIHGPPIKNKQLCLNPKILALYCFLFNGELKNQRSKLNSPPRGIFPAQKQRLHLSHMYQVNEHCGTGRDGFDAVRT
jgi:hypothetical protein